MISLVNLFDVAASVYALYLLNCLLTRRGPPLPPGPTRLPLIGNLFDLPKGYNWFHWAKYKELYGPISSITVMGSTVIILNDQKSSIDLLEKRSFKYSDRPPLHFATMSGWGLTTTFLQYGSTFAAHRKNIHQFVGTKEAISRFHPIEELEARRLVSRILVKPVQLQEHIRLFAGAIILKIIYGYTVDTEQLDPLVELVEKAMVTGAQALLPGKWIVDIFPIFRFIPAWLPGAGFKRLACSWKEGVDAMANIPHQFVKNQMAKGVAVPSYESFFMEQNPTAEEEVVIKWSATSLYGGGSDTTVSAIYSLFIALQLYPEVQAKAQAEIDSVVGLDRLPTFADRKRLPYIDATVKEVLRWNPITPLSVPHVTREDDVYQGYSIPKGAAVIANLWFINHDPENYHSPDTFMPERFLGVDGRAPEMDPHKVTFGHGRRICPGKELADSSIFIAIAMSLATLTVHKARDNSGREIEPIYEVPDAFICHPKQFGCMITARSAKAKELILSVAEEIVETRSDAAALAGMSLRM